MQHPQTYLQNFSSPLRCAVCADERTARRLNRERAAQIAAAAKGAHVLGDTPMEAAPSVGSAVAVQPPLSDMEGDLLVLEVMKNVKAAKQAAYKGTFA